MTKRDTWFKILYISLFIALFNACNLSERGNGNSEDTTVQVDTLMKDFGEIVQNSKAETIFKIKNIGASKLRLKSVSADCHCTVPTWDKQPVDPGKEAAIKVKFDTKTIGFFQQTVSVELNSKEKHITFLIRGKVVGKS